MPKGLCCAAQAAGDLGKPLVVTVALKTGGTTTRCGVCEIVPSCKNPQKTVFAFRFLKKQECGLPGTACAVTPAGLAQYTAQQGTAAAAGPVGAFTVGGTAGAVTLTPTAGFLGGLPYTLPNP